MLSPHPSGFPRGAEHSRCGTCAWFAAGGCRAAVPYGATPHPLDAQESGCVHHHEGAPSCDPCGACCREAFDAVPAEGGQLPSTHTTAWSEDFVTVRRQAQGRGTRCLCLFGDGRNHPFRCTHYTVRPTACRELEAGSENCLLARRQVGLAPEPPTR